MFLSCKLSGVSQTSCTCLIKVFIVMAFVKSGCRMISHLSVYVGFLYTVICSSLLSWPTKKSRKGSFLFSLISVQFRFSTSMMSSVSNGSLTVDCCIAVLVQCKAN